MQSKILVVVLAILFLGAVAWLLPDGDVDDADRPTGADGRGNASMSRFDPGFATHVSLPGCIGGDLCRFP